METLTLRTSREEWRKDLDLGLSNIGIYRMEDLKATLLKNLNELAEMINDYHSLNARVMPARKLQDFWFSISVNPDDEHLSFYADVIYGVDENHKLYADIYFAARPSTIEFPIAEGIEWRKERLYESEIKDPRYVVTNIKNHFIMFESYKRIGRDILYAVLEE